MIQFKNIQNNHKGFTLIEMMVFIFIFTITGITFYKVFATGTQAMSSVRSRLGAIQLANEKIETIHNLKYEDIGTLGGIPAGKIPQTETDTRSGKTYYVHCSVVAVDDPCGLMTKCRGRIPTGDTAAIKPGSGLSYCAAGPQAARGRFPRAAQTTAQIICIDKPLAGTATQC